MDIIKIYKSENVKKGIIAINFLNPVRSKKTTKSLGKKVGLDHVQADQIISEISEIINNPLYFHDYDGYLQAKSNFSEEALRIVFQNTDLLRSFNEKSIIQSLENKIPLWSEDKRHFLARSIQFIGLPGAGKTKTIQQLLGSVTHNVPATSTSNTTVASFEAHLVQSHQLESTGAFVSEEELQEQLQFNIYDAMESALYMDCDQKELSSEQRSDIYQVLMRSKNLKFNFNILLGRKLDMEMDAFIDTIIQTANAFWAYIQNASNFNELSYQNATKEMKQKLRVAFAEVTLSDEDQIEELSEKIVNKIRAFQNQVLQQFLTLLQTEVAGVEPYFELITRSKKIVYDNKAPWKLNIELEETDWLKSFYFSLSSKTLPDRATHDHFFKLLRFFSCADEGFINLMPIVMKLRIKGNFQPLWKKETDGFKERILIDSEGVGHDSDKLGFSAEIEKNSLYVDRIVWVMDATRGFTKQDQSIVQILALNGCLNKTVCAFNRLEKLDSRSESTPEAKADRITGLMNNLFAPFENRISDDVDYSKFKQLLLKGRLGLEYLHERIVDEEISILSPETRKQLDERAERAKNDLERSIIQEMQKNLGEKYSLKETLIAFDTMLDFPENSSSRLAEALFKKPVYSYIELARACETVTTNFLSDFLNTLRDAHWATVKAFNARIHYGYDNREWHLFTPEFNLKAAFKEKMMHYFMTPRNFDEQDKNDYLEWFQQVQHEIAFVINEIAQEEIVNRNKRHWEYSLLGLFGPGSGNARKAYIKEVMQNTYLPEKQKHNDNVLFNDFVRKIDSISSLKDKKATFIVSEPFA